MTCRVSYSADLPTPEPRFQLQTACFEDSNSFQEGLVMIVLQVNYTLGRTESARQKTNLVEPLGFC